MTLAFELSMPSVNSWNGRWSGEDRCYVVCRTFRGKKQEAKAQALADRGSFGYCFGDGWAARVSVRRVDSAESRRLRKKSNGFCGYDWMVASIIDFGEILNDQQQKERYSASRSATA